MMNHGLPQIVDSRQSLTDDIRKIDRVQVDELKRLWKVYTTNKNVIAAGHRLENLFWRIWSSNRILENISGNTVAHIFLMIDQGEKAISDAYKIPPPTHSVIKRVPIDISVPPTPPPSPFSRLSPSNNILYQPSQTALSASLLQAYPNTPPSPVMPPTVPPPSPVIVSDLSTRPALTRANQSYPQSTNDEQAQIGREIAAEKPSGSSTSGRSQRKPQGILRSSKTERKRRNALSSLSRTASNSSNATASSGTSTPVTEGHDASQSGRETDHTSNSVASARSRSSSQKDSEAGSAKSKEDWLVEPDFRAKYLDQRRKERMSAIAGNPIVKGPLKTGASVATASMTAVSIPRTKRGKGRSILVVDSVAPLKSADDDEPAVPISESAFATISEVIPSLAEKEAFEKPVFQRTKSQLSLMFEQAKRDADGETSNYGGPSVPVSGVASPPPEVIHEHEDHPDDGFEDESEDEPLEIRTRSSSKKSKSKRPKPRSRKSQ